MSRDGGAEPVADELSALRLVKVPDWGRPFDGDPVADNATSAAWEFGFGLDCLQPGPGAVAGTGAPMRAKTDGPDRLETSGEWARQFARLLTETLAGARPVRQILPWTSQRARVHIRRLMPLFGGGQRPHVLRVIATRPTREVIEMTVVVAVGARTRALAVRLEQAVPHQLARPIEQAARTATAAASAPGWVCTDIEAA